IRSRSTGERERWWLVPFDSILSDYPDLRPLARQGWELKGGAICAPVVLGGRHGYAPVWHRAAFDPAVSRGAAALKASLTPAYKTVFLKSLAGAVQRAHEADVAVAGLRALDGAEQKALTEGIDTAGGFLVPGETAGAITAQIAERS